MSDLEHLPPALARRPAALVTLVVVAIVAGVTALVAPHYRALVVYGLYAIPAHLLISFLPHEPAIFVVADMYPPKLIASVGTLSCVAAAILDYWLIGWFVSQHLVRTKVDSWRAYQIAKRLFAKAPFLLIAGSAFAPVPFYPVKILAIASDYSLVRFIVAVMIGRWPRFWLLVLGGRKVQTGNSTWVYLAIALSAVAIWQIWRTRRSSGEPTSSSDSSQ